MVWVLFTSWAIAEKYIVWLRTGAAWHPMSACAGNLTGQLMFCTGQQHPARPGRSKIFSGGLNEACVSRARQNASATASQGSRALMAARLPGCDRIEYLGEHLMLSMLLASRTLHATQLMHAVHW